MNKFLSLLMSMCIAIAFSSCNGDSASGDNGDGGNSGNGGTENVAMKGKMTVDLTQHGYPLMAVVPDSTIAPLSIETTPGGEVLLNAGKHFQVTLIDANDLELIKMDINDDPVFKNTVVKEELGLLVWKSEINDPDSHMPAVYHFCVIKNIGGVDYQLSDYKDSDGFNESSVNDMVSASSMLKGNSNPS